MRPNNTFQVRGAWRAPKSGRERQQAFRERHPDYWRKYRARQKAALAALRADLAAAEAARQVEAARALVARVLAAPTPMLALPAPRPMLALPAPAQAFGSALLEAWTAALGQAGRAADAELVPARHG